MNRVAIVITKPKTSFLKIKNNNAYIKIKIANTFYSCVLYLIIALALEKYKTAIYTNACPGGT